MPWITLVKVERHAAFLRGNRQDAKGPVRPVFVSLGVLSYRNGFKRCRFWEFECSTKSSSSPPCQSSSLWWNHPGKEKSKARGKTLNEVDQLWSSEGFMISSQSFSLVSHKYKKFQGKKNQIIRFSSKHCITCGVSRVSRAKIHSWRHHLVALACHMSALTLRVSWVGWSELSVGLWLSVDIVTQLWVKIHAAGSDSWRQKLRFEKVTKVRNWSFANLVDLEI